MEVTSVAPGLWRWTALHPEWKDEVGCVYCETQDGIVLIDPLVPHDEEDRFWRALDRDVGRMGGAVHVLVTVFSHTRDAAAMVERYGARVWAPSRGRRAIAHRAGVVTDAFRPGERLPGGIEPIPSGKATEVVFWIPAHRTLVPGDVLLGAEGGGVRLCPANWLPAGTTPAHTARTLRPLAALPVERILVSHGEPILEDARAALSACLRVE
ncbi:MAG: MBL fold metallo-hydrolase [Thermoleophilia bacterium]|nr:MBL fold metallo-hydrolase [Gaiellaceae bacterium]MDW8338775.1 MBL fold metallo-hydrolase [Thermoleophilia bacterium]